MQPYINPAVFQKFRRDLVKSLGIEDPDVDVTIPIESRPVQAAPAAPKVPTTLAVSTAPGQPKSAIARALILRGFENKFTPDVIIDQIVAETGMPKTQAKNYFKNGSKQLNLPASFYA